MMALWFFRRSGSRVSIHNPVTAESVLRAPPVSGLTICPLGQPEKATGHESQIEPWLASTTTLLACARNRKRRHRKKDESLPRENPKSLATRRGLETSGIQSAPSSRRGDVSLDFPLIEPGNRTRVRLTDEPGLRRSLVINSGLSCSNNTEK